MGFFEIPAAALRRARLADELPVEILPVFQELSALVLGLPDPADLTAEHERIMGKIMVLASKLAAQEGCHPYPDGGFRVVVNTGTHGGQEVHHLHVHVMGGPRPWARG